MPRKHKVNVIEPNTNQVWEHVVTKIRLLIIDIQNDIALCAVLDGAKSTQKRLRVPLMKFMYRGNRGMLHVETRKRTLPKANWDGVPLFDVRKKDLGVL